MHRKPQTFTSGDEWHPQLKGSRSRVIRSEFPELEEFLWGDSLWAADGYFAETVGQVQEEFVKRYIREQQD